MDASESIARRALDLNPMNRHDLLAQRHVVTGQGVKRRRVQVAVEMDDERELLSFVCRITTEWTHIGAWTSTGGGSEAAQRIALASTRRW